MENIQVVADPHLEALLVVQNMVGITIILIIIVHHLPVVVEVVLEAGIIVLEGIMVVPLCMET
jgi:hypothetical protein